eukprot:TRINITY_DN16418_c0_g2_i5.p1 TRINITY_DN16418_c0_g2~~TRINITY_DN16418_c0_g2_i5.p1  ORF type:complete len:506 (-),score=107.70 TRINITY_DN16418_c0_g2_i5:260-1654(-)
MNEVLKDLLYPDFTLEEYISALERKKLEKSSPMKGKESLQSSAVRLGKQSYLQSQLSPDDVPCQACNDGDYEEDNLIVICADCGISVHQKCYGIRTLPASDWICDVCLRFGPSQGKLLRCPLCPIRGGAMKQTAVSVANLHVQLNMKMLDCKQELTAEELANEPRPERFWIHLSCGYWLPELGFNLVNREITRFEKLDARRLELTCGVCGQRRAGYCVQCSKGNCHIGFHVECARLAGLHMEFVLNDVESGVNLVFCERHRPLKLKRELEAARKKWTEDVVKFCDTVNKCVEIVERNGECTKRSRSSFGSKKVFNKVEKKLLIERVRFICRNYSNLTLNFAKQTTRRNKEKLKLLNESSALRYSDTTNKTLFPWNEVKVDGKFRPVNYYYEYLSLVPDEATFKLEILQLNANQVEQEEQLNKIRIKEEKLLLKEIAFDRKKYCYCKKMVREPGGPMISISRTHA